jgi:hypothetical protein
LALAAWDFWRRDGAVHCWRLADCEGSAGNVASRLSQQPRREMNSLGRE